jgi:hypothetical protein
VNIAPTDEAYAVGETKSYLRTNISAGLPTRGYTQPIPAGDFEAILSMRSFSRVNGIMVGLALLDDTLTGAGVLTYDNPPILGTINAGVYQGLLAQWGSDTSAGPFSNGQPLWFRVRRVATTNYFSASLDGDAWTVEMAWTTPATPPTKIFIGRLFNTGSFHFMFIDRFNVR